MKRGKRYVEAAKLVDRTNLYDASEACLLYTSAWDSLGGSAYPGKKDRSSEKSGLRRPAEKSEQGLPGFGGGWEMGTGASGG